MSGLPSERHADGSARLLWHVSGKRYLDCETALAVQDDKVYVGMGFEGFALVVLDVNTGKALRVPIELTASTGSGPSASASSISIRKNAFRFWHNTLRPIPQSGTKISAKNKYS